MDVKFTAGKLINLTSAAFGMLGTVLLFKGSFSLESPPLWMSPDMVAEMNRRNIRRVPLQRYGLGALLISFSLLALAQFFD